MRSALAAISPEVDRDTWAKLAMACKAEFGAAGFDLWDAWSATAERYTQAEAKSTWRSVKGAGGVTIATLFAIAKEHGFRFPAAGAPAAPAPSAAAVAKAEAERQRKREVEEAKYRARADQAARDAAELWADSAIVEGHSPYLQRKGVKAHGTRTLNGVLLVPMRDAGGTLQNLQRIAPARPATGSDKRYLPGGRKSGLWHQLGTIEGAAVGLIAEGYATAATLHEATGRPVAVAFDAGNLVHVAKALRELHPALPLLVCGDDDQATAERQGENPGRKKAAAAARAVDGDAAPAGAVFPVGLPIELTDFNDLAAHAGVDQVRAQIEAAVGELLARRPGDGPAALPAAPSGGEGEQGAADAPAPPAAPPAGPRGGAGGDGDDEPDRHGFIVNDDGVWFVARDAEGNRKRPVWVCARLDVLALTRADDANGWGYLLAWQDRDGNAKQWSAPSAMFNGDGAEWSARLRDMGLHMAPGLRPRQLLGQYIETRETAERVTCTDRVGWHGPVYVLPSTTIGGAGDGRRFVFQSETGMEDTFRQRGTLQQWQERVGALCVDNTRMVFAVSTALAGPTLRLAGVEGGGVHFRGDSSQGKTTALKVAASVWGKPGYMQRWRTTDNALEATAVQHCDGTLILDEFAQVDPKVAGECAYMLANGQEKGRATRSGVARKRRTWELLFLSSGEVSLAQHMEAVAKSPRAGQEVRMLDVPLDAGQGLGGLEVLHDRDSAAQLADELVTEAARLYGTPGRAWLDWLCAYHADAAERLQGLLRAYRDQFVPEAAAEQVRRAGTRFALIAAAGELATEAGVTGWPKGQALAAGRACFNAWLGARGHLDNGESATMLRQVRQFVEEHGEGRFTWWHRAMDDHNVRTANRAGFRRMLGGDGKPIRSHAEHLREYGDHMSPQSGEAAQVEFFILQEVFRREVCRGFDAETVAKLLRDLGHLGHEEGRLLDKQRLPGMGLTRCYRVLPSIFG